MRHPKKSIATEASCSPPVAWLVLRISFALHLHCTAGRQHAAFGARAPCSPELLEQQERSRAALAQGSGRQVACSLGSTVPQPL